MDVVAKVKEAEVYISMGLLEDGRKVYHQIQSDGSVLDKSVQQSIAGKIQKLDNEINQQEQDDHLAITEKDVAFVKNTLSISDESPEVLYSATAFMEMGLYREALREYGKLFSQEKGWRDIIPNATTCLLKCCSSSEIPDHFNQIIDHKGIDNNKKSEIKFLIGQELEKKNLSTLALKFYDSKHGSGKSTPKIINRLKRLFSFPRLLTAFASIFAVAIISYLIVSILQLCFLISLFGYEKPV